MDISSRGTLRGQFTKLSKSSIEYLSASETKPVIENAGNFDAVIEELVSALSRLTAVHESIQKANENVLKSIKEEDREKEYESISDYSDKYVDVSSRLKTRIDRLKALRDRDISSINLDTTSSQQVQRHVVRLPRLELKKFNGDCKDWLPFWEQFKVLVHENTALSTCDKFNYLQSSLGGRAATSLAGLSATSACYDSAIALLHEEFGDVAKLVDKHMAALMNLKTVISSHDVVGLRELYNTVVTNSRSLAGLGVSANNYYVMLKTILVRCLPHDLRVEYYRLTDKNDDEASEDCADEAASTSTKSASGTFSFAIDKGVKDLLKFLKREIQSLERAGENNKSVQATFRHSSVKSIKTAAGLIAPTEGKKFCIFCKTDSHFSDKCDGKLGLAERKEILKKEGRCFRCTKRGHMSTHCPAKHVRCSNCRGRHVLALCDPEFASRKLGSIHDKKISVPDCVNLCSPNTFSSNVYLQTACVYISPPENRTKTILGRIVIDSGSQRSYVREDLAKKLDLPIIDKVKIKILPFGSSKGKPTQVCNRVKVCLRSIYTEELIVVAAVVVPEICADILPVPNTSNSLFSEFRLADTRLAAVSIDGISVLVGSDFYWKVVSGKIKRLTDTLTAIHTKFGWAIQGPENENHAPDIEAATMLSISLEDDATFMEDIRNMWRLESLGITPPDEVNETLNIDQYVSRHETHYEASLLWSLTPATLDNNREGAYQRFKSLVRKLSREPHKLLSYDAAMREMISKGFAETVALSMPGDSPIYFMPHRPIYREDKTTTKLRIVFDASAKSRGNTSLNDHLDAGPNLLPDILTILLNFRLGAIALIADIEKAFLQIMLAEKERDVHRFFWFKDPLRSGDSLPSAQEFRMTRVTFGVKCSPFILAAVLQKHLIEESTNHPEVCKLMLNSFYMDDLVASVNDKETAKRVYVEACELMRKASMSIRKWNSNEAQLREIFAASGDVPAIQKVLGVLWFCLTDEISVDLQPVLEFLANSKTSPSKRKVLQIMARIFDPLGMFSPFIVKVKILFQELWRLKLSWDEELPQSYTKTWNKCCGELEQLQGLTINRRLVASDAESIFQLHIFADASPSAYGTVAYLRSQSGSSIETRFICSKNRIAPLKQNKKGQLTLPKLELTAALMASRLLQFIRKNLNFRFAQTYLWTDSKIALHWIRGDISRWEKYVANRVREIRELTTVDLWNHCPGTSNPADYLTRGDFNKLLANSDNWINGPSWLSQSNNEWPKEIKDGFEDATMSLYVQGVAENIPENNLLFDASSLSSYTRLLRITAYVLRFVRNSQSLSNRPPNIFLTGLEIADAEKHWIKKTQHCSYRAEIEALKLDKRIPSNSAILTLNPILDENDILRVGSRIAYMESDYEAIYPAILPRSHHITRLIVLDAHHRTLHGGVNAVLVKLREKFWVPRSRQLIKTIIRSCSLCRRLFCKAAEQPFASLPRSRLVSARPFETVGIDFAGPLYVKLNLDAITTNKAYIMLLTCSTVRAVHLELVPNLTVESCILALRRFIARRGTPKKIISDNARTFKRAGKEMGQLGDFISTEKFQGYVTNEKIIWQFIVERAPWWGGFWERLVRTIKNTLKASIGRSTLTCDEMQTTLAEAEAIINNRPLTYMSDDPKDLTPLTPGHFLHPSIPLVSSSISKAQNSSGAIIRDLWKARFKLINSFWRRWRTEYVHLLRGAHHSKRCTNPTILSEGDVVLVHDPAVRRLFWKLAIVENVFPGRDGKIRSCEIRLSDGSRLRRAIQLLYPLELHDEETSSARPEDVEN